MSDKKRVMWLLNHTSARKFEIPMLKACGVDEIFLPKSFPADPTFRSASIDWSEDENLTIPKEDLDILNACDWYTGATLEAWEVANKWFDMVFFISYDARLLINLTKYFHGVIVHRVYGLPSELTYGKLLNFITEGKISNYIRRLGNRFVFGMAYENLSNQEPDFLKRRAFYLPLGMKDVAVEDEWTGKNKRILFVCPDIAINPYYNKAYKEFIDNFSDFDYIVSGAQPIKVMDKNVLGFVDYETHNENMRDSMVMFYHSSEPYHIHYHPFEAIKNGMPLIFMANGMLDRLGGQDLPGRCTTIGEAKKKIKRLMEGDKKFTSQLKKSQEKLLVAMDFERLLPYWNKAFHTIQKTSFNSQIPLKEQYKEKKIAVILPIGYLGGSLRGAILIANELYENSVKNNEPCKVIFYHINDEIYQSDMFEDLNPRISIRPFKWKTLDRAEAHRSMEYAGYEGWENKSNEYFIPDDGINYGFDCDLWFLISDRLEKPLLPVKPVVMMVYDYLQRRNNHIENQLNNNFIDVARSADKVLVTTQFTYNDALQYAGIKKEKLTKVPMLIPNFLMNDRHCEEVSDIEKNNAIKPFGEYFIWPTNSNPHKHMDKIFQALKIYYDIYNGTMNCIITGLNTEKLLSMNGEHASVAKKHYKDSRLLKKKIKMQGNLSELEYKMFLKNANFLLHSSHGDNGTFSVIEAALFNVPSLANLYPAIKEMDHNYALNLTYFDVFDVHNTAKKIKWMEVNYKEVKANLPSPEKVSERAYDNHGVKYWEVVRNLL
ncbi:hypothetical protein [Atlantibacter hermannii]|uniref:hypothetical protein n=1 Tax=Atlantibacter hermannii TaxID=565 RepID=UPI002899EC7F|nr:hypothetical protein [Atlantibacter hermannii]